MLLTNRTSAMTDCRLPASWPRAPRISGKQQLFIAQKPSTQYPSINKIAGINDIHGYSLNSFSKTEQGFARTP